MKNIMTLALMSILCIVADSSAINTKLMVVQNFSGVPCSITISGNSYEFSNCETKTLDLNLPNENINIFFVAYKIITSASIDVTQLGRILRICNQNQPTSDTLTFPFNPALYNHGTILPNQKNYFLDLSKVPPTLTQIGS